MSLFKKHTYKCFYEINCPLNIWDTTVETQLFVPVVGLSGKCIVVKDECSFDRIPLAKFRDIVNFVIEM